LRRLWRVAATVLIPMCAVVFVGVGAAKTHLPTAYYVNEGQELSLPGSILKADTSDVWQTSSSPEGGYEAQVRLLGVIPVGEVHVEVTAEREVAVCGVPFGIKMFTEGVLVVGIADVDTRKGARSPASEAGLRVGDCILAIDGEEVVTTDQVASVVENSGGEPLTMTVRRQGVTFDVTLTPAASVTEQCLKAGLWIRDSSAGIGTLTFFDSQTNVFGGLGHPVNDADTGPTIPISSGEIVPASVFGVNKGKVGAPGELLGSFLSGSWGVLTANDETGLYGVLHDQPPVYATLPVAYKQDVTEGAAQVITTVSGSAPKAYDIVIEEVDYRDDQPTRNMVIHITDEELLDKTGGVVCGMSGSPIIQNGALVGAVTHVFVSDPTSGYGIFVENMFETANAVYEHRQSQAAS